MLSGLGNSMLQLNKAQSAISHEQQAPEIISGAETLQLFVSFFRRQFSVIVIVSFWRQRLADLRDDCATDVHGSGAVDD